LSKTVNFSNITDIPSVTGAIVEIADSSGITDTLTEVGEGIYSTNRISGIPGHSYKLTIKSDDKVYESVSSMSYPISNFKVNITREVNDGSSFW
jgi:hypothetical protein